MKERLIRTAVSASSLYFIYRLLTSAFSREVRRQIVERAGNKCEECGADGKWMKMEAAHLSHRKDNPKYNHPDTGILTCRPCHYRQHLEARGNSMEELGLPEAHNEYAIKSIWGRMNRLEKNKLRGPDDPKMLPGFEAV